MMPGIQLRRIEVDDEELMEPRQAPAKGFPDGTVVQLSAEAYAGASDDDGDENDAVAAAYSVRYIRSALLETVPTEDPSGSVADDSNEVFTQGIQVLNFVVFPSNETDLPVWGADLVSLPGNKHLWLLDAQPMIPPPVPNSVSGNQDGGDNDEQEVEQHGNGNAKYDIAYSDWYDKYIGNSNDPSSKPSSRDSVFPWGGDLPPQVQPYVSRYALWTRHTAESPTDVPLTITTQLEDAVLEHLDIYLGQIATFNKKAANTATAINHQEAYVDYRKNNDPAKPMLKMLYGEHFTNEILEQVLFPAIQANK